jgi:hypothetical protein
MAWAGAHPFGARGITAAAGMLRQGAHQKIDWSGAIRLGIPELGSHKKHFPGIWATKPTLLDTGVIIGLPPAGSELTDSRERKHLSPSYRCVCTGDAVKASHWVFPHLDVCD